MSAPEDDQGHGRPPEWYCGASRRQGGTCAHRAGYMTDHLGYGRCKFHGGRTPSQSQHAQLAKVREAAQIFGVPRQIDPAEGLMEEYWRTAGLVSAYEAHVMMLKREELTFGIAQTVDEAEGVGTLEDAGADGSTPEQRQIAWRRRVVRQATTNALVRLYNEERETFFRRGAKIVELGLEARRTAIMGTQVSILAGIVMHPELALSDDQRRTMARLLREIDGGGIAA